jgi:hypothetical protein
LTDHRVTSGCSSATCLPVFLTFPAKAQEFS